MHRKGLVALLVLLLFAGILPLPMARADDSIRVTVDGRLLSFDVPPQIVDGRTLVPLRAIFEALGASITWDGATQTVTAVRGDRTVILQVGAPTATVNGQPVTLAVPAQIIGGRTMVPLRFVAEALGAGVEWEGETRTARITSPPAPGGSVTAVEVTAAATAIGTRDKSTLTASVKGTGSFDSGIRWSVVSGGGSLSATSGASITYQAPATIGTAVVRATAAADPGKYAEVTLTISGGPVHVLAAEGLVTAPANFIDLEGRTLRFTPAAGGGYTLEVLPLDFRAPTGEVLAPAQSVAPWPVLGWSVDLPFAFPFGGQTWRSLYVNKFGNLSFGQPEGKVWPQRDPWPQGTMHSVAASLDARSAAGLEYVIAALWNYYHQDDHGTITVDREAGSLTVTWEIRRMDGRIGFTEKTEPSLFQARLYPTGAVELAYKRLAEKDGIAGLFPGLTGTTGIRLDHADDPLDAPDPSVEVRSVDLYDLGTVLKFAFTMGGDVPTGVDKGELMHRVFLEYGGKVCSVHSSTKQGVSAGSECGFTPGVLVSGSEVDLLVPRSALGGADTLQWWGDVVWWGIDGRFDQFFDHRSVSLSPHSLHLAGSSGKRLFGNIFEAFHYPVLPKLPEEVFPAIYRRFAPEDDIAFVYTDFRVDALFASGGSSGRINVPVKGIGEAYATARPGANFGSSRLQATMAPVYIGSPFLAESYAGEGYTTHNYGRGLDWIAHEITHSWGAGLRFKNPVTGQVEPLYQDEPCHCHWSEWLHLPSYYPVLDEYSQGYYEHSIMGTASGNYWTDNGDGTFTRHAKPYHFPAGLSALDLYMMGLMRPEEVPETFLLAHPSQPNGGRVRAEKVPVRISDIIAAMGPRDPGYATAQKSFKLGVYLLTEPGSAADPALHQRAQELGAAIARHFRLITGGRMQVTLTG